MALLMNTISPANPEAGQILKSDRLAVYVTLGKPGTPVTQQFPGLLLGCQKIRARGGYHLPPQELYYGHL